MQNRRPDTKRDPKRRHNKEVWYEMRDQGEDDDERVRRSSSQPLNPDHRETGYDPGGHEAPDECPYALCYPEGRIGDGPLVEDLAHPGHIQGGESHSEEAPDDVAHHRATQECMRVNESQTLA